MLDRILTVGGYTLLSRLTGFMRDIMLAAIIGAGPVADAFFVAFRLPNHFRAIFAEGAFNAAFIPAAASLAMLHTFRIDVASSARSSRGPVPLPLWGGVRGGGREAGHQRQRMCATSRPPPPPSPQGGGRSLLLGPASPG